MRPMPSRKLNKRITRVWRASALINLLVWGLLGIGSVYALWRLADSPGEFHDDVAAQGFWLALLVGIAIWLVLFVVFVVIVPKIRWIQWSFEIYDEEIDIHKGIFWRKRIIIPLIRVQNVDTRQGPLMRIAGLSSFAVSTAAGQHEIPGLEIAEADETRDRVAVLARIAQEDV
ncbi:MAG: PH domain-containing protein [Coriobacteriia bacterium]|nr:PH domain-containing protein [Coriobacteriia bacterium]